MSLAQKEIEAIVVSTLKVYQQSAADAWYGMRKNWLAIFVPAGYFFVMIAFSFVASILPGLLGGFLLGIVIALCLANYLAFVAAASHREKLLKQEIWRETISLFFPLIGVMFALYLIDILLSIVFPGQDKRVIRMIVNVCVVVVYNALPEVLYNSRQTTFSIFGECWEFIQENVIEWFIPLFLVLLPMFIANPAVMLQNFASTNPLLLPELVFSAVGRYGMSQNQHMMALIVFFSLAFSFYFMAFRGALYKRLAVSSRRKRVYQYRMGE